MTNIHKNGKLITCILPKGEALPLLQALADMGVTRANFAFARGFDIHDHDNPRKGFPDEVEKEIVTVIADDKAKGEELFNFIWMQGKLNRLGGGLMHMTKLGKSSVYLLPEIEQAQQAAKEASAPEATV